MKQAVTPESTEHKIKRWADKLASSETQAFKGDGKGREKLGAGKKERGGEGKGKRKGEALGSFSIQIISRSKSKHH